MNLLYKPFSLMLSALAGVLAGSVFKRVWKAVSGKDDVPSATDADSTWREVLLAAAIQGAVFALFKAAMDRAGAAGVHKATGRWPGS